MAKSKKTDYAGNATSVVGKKEANNGRRKKVVGTCVRPSCKAPAQQKQKKHVFLLLPNLVSAAGLQV